jgi:hypothetical protein
LLQALVIFSLSLDSHGTSCGCAIQLVPNESKPVTRDGRAAAGEGPQLLQVFTLGLCQARTLEAIELADKFAHLTGKKVAGAATPLATIARISSDSASRVVP